MRTKAKRDANERAIIDALQGYGIGVYQLSDPGAPDLLTWLDDRIILLEVKSKTGRLTKAQQTYVGPRVVVRTPTAALAAWGIGDA